MYVSTEIHSPLYIVLTDKDQVRMNTLFIEKLTNYMYRQPTIGPGLACIF